MRFPSLMVLALLAAPLQALAAGAPAAAGDAVKGQEVFKRCAVCHSVDKDGGDGLGPNLFGIVGKKAGARPGYAYSAPLQSSGLVWTPANLTKWVAGPGRMVPGTKMMFAGITSKSQQADVVAYLASKK